MKQIMPILLLFLATAHFSSKAMDQEQDELRQALPISAAQYQQEQTQQTQQDIDEELEFAKALSISGQEEVEQQRQQAVARREILASAAQARINPQAAHQSEEQSYDAISLEGLPSELQEKVVFSVLTSTKTLKELIQILYTFARTNRQLYDLVTNRSFVEQIKKFIQQRNQQAELNDLFFYYSRIGNKDVVRLLLRFGANPDSAIPNDGITPLMLATMMENTPLVRILLGAGANVNARDNTDNTALMYAAMIENDEIMRILLNAKADIKATNKNGMTALLNAAELGRTEIVRTLLAAGANPNTADNDGLTPLMYAVKRDDIETVRVLLNADADVNAANNKRMTALMFAALNGNTAIARILLDAGADTHAIDRDRRNARSYARESNNFEIMSLFEYAR